MIGLIKTVRTLAEAGLCGYICTYGAQSIEVYASTSYEAQTKAANALKVPAKKRYLVNPHLCERADGSEVLQSTCN